MKRLGCSIHSLHRFIVHDIQQNPNFKVFNNTANKLKRIYKFLNYNTENILKIQKTFENNQLFDVLSEATDIFSTLENDSQFQFLSDEIDDSLPGHKGLGTLKNSNDTRWNTLCYMFDSFSKNQKVVNIALVEMGKTELALTTMDKVMMDEFLGFLKIFEDATKHLQGRKYPTITSNIVFNENIMDCLTQKSELACVEECINMYYFAIANFYKRFKICKIHLVAALLDPIQKSWSRLDKWLKKIPANKPMDLFDELTVDDPNGGISRSHLILTEIKNLKNQEDFNKEDTDLPTTSKKAKKQVINTDRKFNIFY